MPTMRVRVIGPPRERSEHHRPTRRSTGHPAHRPSRACRHFGRLTSQSGLTDPGRSGNDDTLVLAIVERLADEAEFLRTAQQRPAICHGQNGSGPATSQPSHCLRRATLLPSDATCVKAVATRPPGSVPGLRGSAGFTARATWIQAAMRLSDGLVGSGELPKADLAPTARSLPSKTEYRPWSTR